MEVNVTLISVLIIVLLFIPGFFFKRFYYSGQFTKQFNAGTFAERFITGIFWGLFVQLASIFITGYYFKLDYSLLRGPVSNFFSDIEKKQLPDCPSNYFIWGIEYILGTIILACILGLTFHKIVRIFRLDIHFPILRFTNYWNYYLRGDIPSLRGASKEGSVISTLVDVLTNDSSGKTRLYTGYIEHYTISHLTGELETIALTAAERWSSKQNKFVSIQGDALILPYKSVVNLNVRYQIKEVDKKQRYISIMGKTTLVVLLATAIFILFYFYHKIAWYRILFACILLLLDWFFAFSLLTIPIIKVPTQLKKWQYYTVLSIFFSFFAIATLLLLFY